MNGAPSVTDHGPRLPKQVQRAARRAAMLERQQQERAGSPDTQPDVVTPASQAAAAVVPAAGAPNLGESTQTAQQPATVSPANGSTNGSTQPADSTAQVPTQPGADSHDGDAAFWRNRYHSTQGVLRTERSRHSEEIAALQGQLTDLQAKAVQQQGADKPIDVKLEDYLTAQEIDEIGEARAAQVVRTAIAAGTNAAKAMVEQALTPLRKQQEADRERIQRTREQQQTDARQECLDALTAEVPDWQITNQSMQWKAWLRQRDATTGLERQDIIDAALDRNDHVPIASLLRQFVKTLPAPAVTPGAPPPVTPRQESGSGGETPPPQEPVEILTPAKVKQMYTRNAIRRDITEAQRDAEKARIDAMVEKASAAGTLRRQ